MSSCGSINAVNDTIKPITDLEHWGVSERWNYPDDGYGDCEDYVLLKRKMLTQAGWPRQALLITVVRDKQGDGHAVLTVKTDKGEFILDNQNRRRPALVGDRIPLREAAVADRCECLDRAGRSASCNRHRDVALDYAAGRDASVNTASVVVNASSDPLEALGILLPAPHVDVGAAGDRLRGSFIERANRARRRSQDQ